MKLRFQQTFRSRNVLFLIALLSGATGVPIASAVSGYGHWDRQFSLPGVTNLPLGSGLFSITIARALGFAVRGDDLYIAGTFDAVGVGEAGSFCRWNENVDFTPPPVMRFSNTQLLPGGFFRSRITATQRAAYVIERSDDFL